LRWQEDELGLVLRGGGLRRLASIGGHDLGIDVEALVLERAGDAGDAVRGDVVGELDKVVKRQVADDKGVVVEVQVAGVGAGVVDADGGDVVGRHGLRQGDEAGRAFVLELSMGGGREEDDCNSNWERPA
jgi:hypothetical protein